jgi:Glycosyltransferase family 87
MIKVANKSTQDDGKPDFALNLALMTIAIFYLAQIGLDLLVWKTMCGNLGGDYCAYWSAAKIANEQGYAEVYDLEKLGRIEQSIYPSSLPFGVRPIPYLPMFIIPFQVLSFLNPFSGYWLWFLFNVMACLSYLRYFIKQTIAQPIEKRLLLMIMLSLPMFSNLYFGQINIWLMICVGEHLKAALSGKTFQAGTWLGLLWLKPQYLVLICLALLLQRHIKMLAGFATSSIFIIVISILMLGMAGFQKLMTLWIGYTGELSAVDPYLMMNWRMVAENTIPYIGRVAGWTIALIGIMATLVVTIRMWRQPIPTPSSSYPVVFLGTMVATTALTWHSHIFSAIILFAPLAYLAQRKDGIPRSLLIVWVLIPPTTQFLAILLAVIIRESGLPNNLGNLLNFMYAGGQLGANLGLLYWAALKSQGLSFFAKNSIGQDQA